MIEGSGGRAAPPDWDWGVANRSGTGNLVGWGNLN
jgi:hypothetical protein